MKKEDQHITLLNSDVVSDNGQIRDNFKTTNINILLNRVRLDKKRIRITFCLVASITSAVVYFII